MKLRVLGSSSSGNGYLLQSHRTGEVLTLEAGVDFKKVKKALDFNLQKVVGCCITHEHGDHAKYARHFAEAHIPVLMSQGTYDALSLQGLSAVHTLKPRQTYTFGNFRIMPFPVQHDAKEPFGYLIQHPECGTVLFATDTYYLRYRFAHLSNILIECNYSLELLRDNMEQGLIDRKRYDRTVKSHMSYDTCRETLLANDLSEVNNIVLLHLSADNSNAEAFRQGIASATGKDVTIAATDMVIPFDKTPY